MCPLATVVPLLVGDIVYKQIAIELKSWSDFITALTSKKDDRYRKQLYNFLINEEVDGYYIIYGNFNEINKYSQINMHAVLGALASIQARYHVKLLTLPNKDYAIYTALKIIEKTLDRKDVRPVTYKVGTDERAVDGLVAIGERIGGEDALKLLEHFGTFKNVINATKKEMVEIHKIGDTKADNMLKVIHYDFKNKVEFEKTIEELGIIDIEKDKVKDIPKPKEIDVVADVVESDITTLKELALKAIVLYSNKNKKPIPLTHIFKEVVKTKKTTKGKLKMALNDLEMDGKIVLVDEELYDLS